MKIKALLLAAAGIIAFSAIGMGTAHAQTTTGMMGGSTTGMMGGMGGCGCGSSVVAGYGPCTATAGIGSGMTFLVTVYPLGSGASLGYGLGGYANAGNYAYGGLAGGYGGMLGGYGNVGYGYGGIGGGLGYGGGMYL